MKLFARIKKFVGENKYGAIKLCLILTAIAIVAIVFAPHQVTAADTGASFLVDVGLAAILRVISSMLWMIMNVVSLILTISGFLLDLVIQYSIVNFAQFVNGPNGKAIVSIGWTITRDLSNLVFIFLILWLAISTILGLAQGTMKSVLRIVIAAVLINFSLFVAEAVIDASNILALHFYNLITNNGTPGASLSAVFMSGMNVQTFWSSTWLQGNGNNFARLELETKSILMFVMGSLTMLVASWIFFAAAIIFLIRLIYLILLMIMSPLAFVAWVVPGFSGMTKNWWHKLFSQAFFAPIFMLIVYIVGLAVKEGALNFVNGDFSKMVTDLTASAGQAPNMSSVGVVLNFILLVGLLCAALIAGQKMGVAGATTMVNWGNKIRQTGQSWAAGRTVGMAARWADERLKNTYVGNTHIGKTLREWTTVSLKESKFGGKYSAEERHKEDLELKTKRREAELEKGYRGATGLGPVQAERKGMVQLADDIEATEKAILEAKKADNKDEVARLEIQSNALRDQIQSHINEMSPSAIANMDKNTLRNRYVMEYMTTSGINAIKGSKDFTDEEKKEFVGAWLKNLQRNIENYEHSTERKERRERELLTEVAEAKTPEEKKQKEEKMKAEMEALEKQIRSEGGILDMMTDARGLYDRIREMNVNALNTAHWANPDLFKHKAFVATVRYGAIQQLRQSEELTSGEKENVIRIAKDYRGVQAMDDIDGLGVGGPDGKRVDEWTKMLGGLSDTEKTQFPKLVKALENMIAAGKEVSQIQDVDERDKAWENKKMSLRGDIKKMSVEEQEVYKSHFTPVLEAFREFGENQMDDFVNGRSTTEMGYAKGALRTRKGYLDRMSTAILNTSQWRERDIGDKAPIIKHLIEAYGMEQEALRTGGTYRMTDANRGALRWLLMTPPDKQSFFNSYESITPEDPKTQEKLNNILAIARKDDSLRDIRGEPALQVPGGTGGNPPAAGGQTGGTPPAQPPGGAGAPPAGGGQGQQNPNNQPRGTGTPGMTSPIV